MTESKESIKKQAIYERNYRRARERALVRLGREFPDLYRQYLDEERRKDEEQGKAWVDFDFDSGLPIRAFSKDERGQTANGLGDRISPRHNGGEA